MNFISLTENIVKIIGCFDPPHQSNKPTYDPGFNVACPYCSKLLGEYDQDLNRVMAIGLSSLPTEANKDKEKSYFYRVHYDCLRKAEKSGASEAFENMIIDHIAKEAKL